MTRTSISPQGHAPPARPDAESAGVAAAEELISAAPTEDLRDGIDPSLRATGSYATRVDAVGCPCGCGETQLVLRARAGDEEAVNELLNRYRVLARSKARSYFVLGADRDDVVQEGMIGVYKAVRDFDETRGASFRTFAEVCVTRQIQSAVTKATRLKHAPLSQSVSLDRPVDEADTASLAEMLPAPDSSDPAAAVVSADEMRAVQEHFDEVLSDLEHQVLRHHMEGKSYDDIAAMLQRHVKSVDNALARIKRKLLAHLEQRGAADAC